MSEMSKFVMPDVSFVEDYEPTSQLGRKAEANPFDAVVAQLAETWSDEIKRSKRGVTLKFAITVDGDKVTESARTSTTQKFGAAANNAGYSARYDDKANETVKDDESGEELHLGVIVAYLIPRIIRARKGTVAVSHVTDNQPEPDKTDEKAEATQS
jgi:hypothetical protein